MFTNAIVKKKNHLSYVGSDLLLPLSCLSGVYVPTGTGIGPGGVGTGTGFFPGNRAASNGCLAALDLSNPGLSHNRVCL